MNRLVRKLAVTVVLATVGAGCSPMVVTSITRNDDQLTFLYQRKTSAFSADSGVITCRSDESGTLEDCRKREIIYKE